MRHMKIGDKLKFRTSIFDDLYSEGSIRTFDFQTSCVMVDLTIWENVPVKEHLLGTGRALYALHVNEYNYERNKDYITRLPTQSEIETARLDALFDKHQAEGEF